MDKVGVIIEKMKEKYGLTDKDVFYTRSNEPAELVYNKDGVKVYLQPFYGYIDVIY